jgi:hypothetical protein
VAREADNPVEAMSETTAQGFSPALRAALTSVTGALFFARRPRSHELPRIESAYRCFVALTRVSQIGDRYLKLIKPHTDKETNAAPKRVRGSTGRRQT